MSKAEEILDKAQTWLINDPKHLYFGIRAMEHEMIPGNVGTMNTDGQGKFTYDPEFVGSLILTHAVFVLTHEVLHDDKLHPFLMQQYNLEPELANVSGDIEINIELIDVGYQPPPGVIVDYRFRGMGMVEIYKVLWKEKKEKEKQQSGQNNDQQKDTQKSQGTQSGDQQNKQSSTPDPGRCGGFTIPKDNKGQELDQTGIVDAKKKIIEDVVSAAQASKGAGYLPGWIEEMMRKVVMPEKKWQHRLREFVSTVVHDEYDWRFPDEEYMQRGYYIPTLHNEGVVEIIIAEDKSGSMDDELHHELCAEEQVVLDEIRPDVLRKLYFDTEVRKEIEYRVGDVIDTAVMSSGGTRFQPVFDYIEEKGYMPACVVMMTDMDSSDRPEDPGYPVLWVSYGTRGARFGEVVKVKE